MHISVLFLILWSSVSMPFFFSKKREDFVFIQGYCMDKIRHCFLNKQFFNVLLRKFVCVCVHLCICIFIFLTPPHTCFLSFECSETIIHFQFQQDRAVCCVLLALQALSSSSASDQPSLSTPAPSCAAPWPCRTCHPVHFILLWLTMKAPRYL